MDFVNLVLDLQYGELLVFPAMMMSPYEWKILGWDQSTPKKQTNKLIFTNFVLSAICCRELFPLSSDWESRLFPLQARVCVFCTRRPLCGVLFPIPGYMNFVWVLSHVESYFPTQSTWILYKSSPMWRVISLSRVHGFCRRPLLCRELFHLPSDWVIWLFPFPDLKSYFNYQGT